MQWMLLVVLIILVSCFVLLRRYRTEGFGSKLDTQREFANEQSTTFKDKAKKSIFTNIGLDLSNLDAAMWQPELYLPKSPDRSYTSFFEPDPSKLLDDRDSMCRQAKHPRELPKRKIGEKLGCGWYFVADPAIHSVGLYGQSSGPSTTDLPPNGQWMWNLDSAAQKEDIKFCKKYKTCSALHINDVKQRCSFCPSEGYAVPILSNGDQAYPNSPDGSCGQNLIKDPNDCDKPTAPDTTLTSDGKSCGTMGFPSPDNSLRYYQQVECETLNGVYLPSGECLKKNEGSYSWDCRVLNNPPDPLPSLENSICSPNAMGELSTDCLMNLAKSMGFLASGGLIRGYTSPETLTAEEYQRITIAAQSDDITNYLGFSLPEYKTDLDVPTATNRLNKIYNGMTHSNKFISGMAKWAVNGSELPDLCAADPTSNGPFIPECLQQAFRMAGCQPAGKAYPKESKSFSNKTWEEIQTGFKTLYNTMQSTDSKIQNKAISDCLGIEYYKKPDKNYTFVQGMDSGGNDLVKGPADNIKELIDTCNANPNCKGFNTNGWIKHTISPQSYWTKWTSDKQKGLYIKKAPHGYLGCFKDCSEGRALPNNRSWNMPGTPEEKKKTCENLARTAGDNLYGLQYNHECWSGKDVAYDRMGAAQNCPPTGGSCTQQVYRVQ